MNGVTLSICCAVIRFLSLLSIEIQSIVMCRSRPRRPARLFRTSACIGLTAYRPISTISVDEVKWPYVPFIELRWAIPVRPNRDLPTSNGSYPRDKMSTRAVRNLRPEWPHKMFASIRPVGYGGFHFYTRWIAVRDGRSRHGEPIALFDTTLSAPIEIDARQASPSCPFRERKPCPNR
jgi:hypothetical protein